MPQATILRIARRNNRWQYMLIPPHNIVFGPAALPLVEVEVDPSLLHTLSVRLTASVNDANASTDPSSVSTRVFARTGRALFSTLFPQGPDTDPLRRTLAKLEGPLLLITDEQDVFWECIYLGEGEEDNQGFLGTRIDVGRSLVAAGVPTLPVAKPRRRWRCLLISNPTGDLDSNVAEAQQLRQWFDDRGFECHPLVSDEATMENVVSALLREWDIIHYSGHVEPDTSSLVLCGEQLMSPVALRPLIRGAPIIFVNGCESASVELLTEALIRGGAQAVVGSLFQLLPEGAAEFSRSFYSSLLEGKTLGEAMRLSRSHVLGRAGCAAAWAGFVLYGDPCLKIRVDQDPLEQALQRIKLNPRVFDDGARAVIHEAYRFGFRSGVITTACVLGAMLTGNDPFLRDRLGRMNLLTRQLNLAFQAVFSNGDEEPESQEGGDTPLKFSRNAEKWLHRAKEIATGPITQRDLVRGLILLDAGGAAQMLEDLRVPLSSLDPDKPFVPSIQSVGDLDERLCTPEAWRALCAAAEDAATKGTKTVSTPHFLVGLQANPVGPLSLCLKKAGLEVDFETWATSLGMSTKPGMEVRCSETVNEIVAMAQAATEGKRPVSEVDLLNAFVQAGAGAVKRRLIEEGIWDELAADIKVTGRTIQMVGPVAASDCSPEAWRVLEDAAEFAGKSGHKEVSTVHLAAAMHQDGILGNRLIELGSPLNPTSWLKMLSSRRYLAGRVKCSNNTSQMLVLAQASAAAGMRPVSIADLFQAFVEVGGGEAGKRLHAAGFPVVTLVSNLFHRGGSLDLERFDAGAAAVIEKAVEFAGSRRWPYVGRDHLTYAMLTYGGDFTSRARNDLDPERLGDLLFNELSSPPQRQEGIHLTPHLKMFTQGLIEVLCKAENAAGRKTRINERDLARAWAESGGGASGKLLIQNGLRIRKLLE